MSTLYYPTPKFKVGDRVIADGDIAVVTEILPAADSDWNQILGLYQYYKGLLK
jgi:hypothetical protein